jgi:transglutaminase-like putative cysteine protease
MTVAAARSHLAATLVFAASLALIATQAPLWCVGLALAASAWRVAVATGRLPELQLRKGMRFGFGALTALLVFAVLMSFRTLNGLAAGTALLTLMGALKLIESRSRRDDGIVIGVALFMLLAAALANQALWRLPLYLLVVWGAGAAMALIAHSGSSLAVRGALRLSARALLMALPLAVACFIFFPRIAGQFWALESGQSATTGLSDELSPGAIDRLVAEYDPVFRVRFLDATPPPEARYWRGPVLNAFDGYTWRRKQRPDDGTLLDSLGERVRQRVTLEPSNRRWVFALDTVETAPRADIRMTSDRQLLAFEPLVDTITYEVSSNLRSAAIGDLTADDRRDETQLPQDRNPRALALARQMRASVSSDAEFTRVALDWFRDNGLEYSLEPEPTSIDSVDSVLFDTKRGFCGHFASAYATLMRAAGVPARVVTGYLGGEYNPIGDYWIVRQSDAHAWTEVWLTDGGWTRIDPTAVVAPERLRSGLYDVLPDSQAGAEVALWRSAWLSRVARLWDGTNEWWRERVLDFNLKSQFDFLRALGIDSPEWEHLGWAFALGLIGWIVWISVTLRRSVARRKPDRIGRAWLKATRKLARVAPAREAAEGPLAYATRIAVVRPDLAQQVHGIAARYGALRYGREASRAAVEVLERDVRRLAV